MTKMIDLLSDTLTLPTEEMMQAILQAELGDAGRTNAAGRGEDRTTNRLEDMSAEITGKEAAAFYPTGTMANTSAILSVCDPGDRILLEERQHILSIEEICFQDKGFRMIPDCYTLDVNGNPDMETICARLSSGEIRLMCIENTNNFSGGTCMSLETMKEISALCRQYRVHLHLDGARIFNAAEAMQVDVKDICDCVDSVMFCISKGLGAPIGSLLCGNEEFIQTAREMRKLLGGSMRQSGIAAACGIYALEHHVERLKEDRENAQRMAEALKGLKVMELKTYPQTNMVILDLEKAGITSGELNRRLQEKGVRGFLVSDTELRMVFHLGITAEDADEASAVVLEIDRELQNRAAE